MKTVDLPRGGIRMEIEVPGKYTDAFKEEAI